MVTPSPLASASPTVKTMAPAVAGMASRNEKRAESGRVKPKKRAAVMVTPERLVPGISAKRLRHADQQRGAQRHVGDGLLLRTDHVGDQHQDAVEDGVPRDHRDVAFEIGDSRIP